MKNLISNLIQARKRAGLTQERVAQLLGVSFTTVSRWENGHSSPTSRFMRDRIRDVVIDLEKMKCVEN